MTLDKIPQEQLHTARHRGWRRPAAVFAGMAVIVLLLVGGGVLISGTAEEPAVGTTPTSMSPPTSTAAPTAQPARTSPMVWRHVVDESLLSGTIWAIAHNDEVLVAVGDDTRPTMGWIGPDDSPNLIVWVSSDARAWSRIDDPALFGGDGIQQAFKISAGPLGFVISGEDGRNTVLWFSTDGYSWQRTFEDDLGTSGTLESLSVVAGGPGWIALDDALNPQDPIYVSDDGRNWTTVSDEAYAEDLRQLFTAATVGGREPVVAPLPDYDWQYAWDGDNVVASQYTGYATLWSSPDAGATWNRVDPDQDAFNVFPRPWLLAIEQYRDLTVVAGNGIWIGWLPE